MPRKHEIDPSIRIDEFDHLLTPNELAQLIFENPEQANRYIQWRILKHRNYYRTYGAVRRRNVQYKAYQREYQRMKRESNKPIIELEILPVS